MLFGSIGDCYQIKGDLVYGFSLNPSMGEIILLEFPLFLTLSLVFLSSHPSYHLFPTLLSSLGTLGLK